MVDFVIEKDAQRSATGRGLAVEGNLIVQILVSKESHVREKPIDDLLVTGLDLRRLFRNRVALRRPFHVPFKLAGNAPDRLNHVPGHLPQTSLVSDCAIAQG